MSDEKQLRRYIIRKFIATLVIVGIAEYVFLAFINDVMFPILGEVYFPQLKDFQLSFGNLVFVVIFMLLFFLSQVSAYFFPGMSGVAVSFLSMALKAYGLGNADNPMAGLSTTGTAMLLITIIATVLIIIMPFAVGAFAFSGQVANKIKILEDKRAAERIENERKRYLMISDIAHDLKTPMTTVSGYARALSDGVVKGDKQQEYLDAITNKTERMNDIVQMLFDYVRLDSEGFELVKREVDVCELVRECVSTVYQDIEDAGDEVDVDIPDTKIMINADTIQFRRVITNLLTNAVKHNAKGTSIGVAIRQEPDEIRLYIADSGAKIDEELAENLFDPFVMGDKSRGSGGGSGLGLSVAKKIIEMHGFKIKLVQAPQIARYNLGEQYNKVFVVIIVV